MRIAVLATSRHPLREPWTGGQESQTATLARSLRALGHHIRLYARAGTDPALADELVSYPDLPPLSAVSALDAHLPEPEFLRDHAAFTAAMTDVLRRDDVDLVHNQSLHHLPLSMSPALAVPVVATLHTPPFPWMELGVALAHPSTTYVCVSEAATRPWTVLPRDPHVIPNGVPVPTGPAGPGGEDLLWFGRLTPEKGVELAIAAARESGRRLRIVGPESDPRYVAQVVRPLLGEDVVHLGHLTSAELGDLLEVSAATLVTPRWDEPFGLVAAESLVRGTPVVTLERGGLAEVVGPRGGVVVDPDGSDPELAVRLAEGVARAVALDRTDVAAWSRSVLGAPLMAQRYSDLFESVVARGRQQ